MKQQETYGRCMIMNGQKKNYENYLRSLNVMQEPKVPKAKLDMRGAILFAKQQGIPVEKLSKEDKDKFIQYL